MGDSKYGKKKDKKGGVNEGIKREEWDEYFKRLLGGVEGKVIRGEKGEKRGEDSKRELSRRKIKEAIGKLKDGKAAGWTKYLGRCGSTEGKRQKDGWKSF